MTGLNAGVEISGVRSCLGKIIETNEDGDGRVDTEVGELDFQFCQCPFAMADAAGKLVIVSYVECDDGPRLVTMAKPQKRDDEQGATLFSDPYNLGRATLVTRKNTLTVRLPPGIPAEPGLMK
jgi:hypothetical protein